MHLALLDEHLQHGPVTEAKLLTATVNGQQHCRSDPTERLTDDPADSHQQRVEDLIGDAVHSVEAEGLTRHQAHPCDRSRSLSPEVAEHVGEWHFLGSEAQSEGRLANLGWSTSVASSTHEIRRKFQHFSWGGFKSVVVFIESQQLRRTLQLIDLLKCSRVRLRG